MNWLERKDKFDERLTIQDREIVAYLDQHIADIQQMTSQELAQACFVSRSSISRLLKKLEIANFAALKFLLREEMAKPKSARSDFSALVNNYHRYIDQIFEKQDLSLYVQLLQETDILYLYGTGNVQKMEVESLRHLLTSVGKQVVVFFDRGEFDYLKPLFKPDDLLLLLSYKGESSEAIAMLKDSRSSILKTMVMTQTSNNSMAKLADYQLYVPTESIVTPTTRTYELSTTFYFIIDQLFYDYCQATGVL
ncbi:MurR/RpiR family transcriptional regulator [Streptococcus jiangjianxini]|uniref:MurR/RpiR family transcriptional regulator n=1 Tax=Streptococcus jiangjianxini TaxID=3161189 RepID=UPI0032EC79E0